MGAQGSQRARLARACSSIEALLHLATALLNGGTEAGVALLMDARSRRNPCLLLLSTAAGGFMQPGPLLLELDMGGHLEVVDGTIWCEAAEIKLSRDGKWS
jgi:hypothetical protein